MLRLRLPRPLKNFTATRSARREAGATGRRHNTRWQGLFCALALCFSVQCLADIYGEVIGVLDGDTIRVEDVNKVRHEVRLASIDAPQKSQPYFSASRKSLSELLHRREVRVVVRATDDEGLVIGEVWVRPPDCRHCDKTLDAAMAQLTAGMAWWARAQAEQQTEEERGQYEFAETEARSKKVGLWHDAHPVAPWEWKCCKSPGQATRGTDKSE